MSLSKQETQTRKILNISMQIFQKRFFFKSNLQTVFVSFQIRLKKHLILKLTPYDMIFVYLILCYIKSKK